MVGKGMDQDQTNAGEEKAKKSFIDYVPEGVQEYLEVTGSMTAFAAKFFVEIFKPPYEIKETLRQAYYLGYKSIVLVSITGFIIGMVMTLQTLPTLAQFGAEAWIPSMISVSIIREIGPVLTALICAGKIGSS